jgi:MFS family permease
MYSALLEQFPLTRAFHARSFTLLWMGQTISVLGDAVFTIAITWAVLLLTGSATAMGVLIIAQWTPKVLLLLFGGVIADRLPRRLLMLWADVGRGCIVIGVAWLSGLHSLQFWHLIVLAPLYGIVSSFFDPAYQAILPQLVEQEALVSANALNTLSRNGGFLLGSMLGAASITLFGSASAFAFDGFTFFFSACCLLALRRPHLPSAFPSLSRVGVQESVETASPFNASHEVLSTMREMREGLRYICGTRWLWVTILVSAGASLGVAGSMWVALPRLVRDVYGSGVWLIGVMAMADAIGSIIAALLLGRARKLHRRGRSAYTGMMVSGVALLACAFPFPFPVEPIIAIVASTLVGAGVAAFMIIWTMLQQEKIPNTMLGRVSSITQLGIASPLPAGLVLAGWLADRIGPAYVFAFGGVLTVVLSALTLCIREIRLLE